MRIAMTEKKVETLANHIEAYGMAGTAHQLRRAKYGGGFFLNQLMPKLYILRNELHESHRKDNESLRNLLDEFILWVEHGFTNSEDIIREARSWYLKVPFAWDRGQALLNIIDRELGPKAAK